MVQILKKCEITHIITMDRLQRWSLQRDYAFTKINSRFGWFARWPFTKARSVLEPWLHSDTKNVPEYFSQTILQH